MRDHSNPWQPGEAAFDERQADALEAARALSQEALLASTEDELVASLVDAHAAAAISPRWDSFSIETHEMRSSEGEGAPSLQVQFALEVEGAANLLLDHNVVSSMRSSSGDDFTTVLFSAALEEGAEAPALAEAIAHFRESWFAELGRAMELANRTAQAHRTELGTAVRIVVASRRNRYLALTTASAQLGIQVNRRDDALPIPAQPKGLTLKDVEQRAGRGQAEPALAEDIADEMIRQIWSFGRALHRLPATANRLVGADEESVRDVLLFVLNANWSGQVTGETFVGRGKTDILMTWRSREAFIGECKIWHGRSAFNAAIDQLLSRYTVWGATRVALILFIKDRQDISAAVDGAWDAVAGHTRFVTETASPVDELRTALMKAQEDENRIVRLTLIPVVIPDRTSG